MGLPSFKLLFERPKNDSEVSAKIIAVYNKHLLLLQNKDGKFELPGGHIKINESLLIYKEPPKHIKFISDLRLPMILSRIGLY